MPRFTTNAYLPSKILNHVKIHSTSQDAHFTGISPYPDIAYPEWISSFGECSIFRPNGRTCPAAWCLDPFTHR
jgi:hypothetical protein